jgi:hypothetical protein
LQSLKHGILLYLIDDQTYNIEICSYDNSKANLQIRILEDNLIVHLGTKSANFDIDLSKSTRQSVTVSADVTISFANLPVKESTTVLIDIIASGARTIAWDASTSADNWVDGDILTSLADGETYTISISTLGSSKTYLLIGWVKKGA